MNWVLHTLIEEYSNMLRWPTAIISIEKLEQLTTKQRGKCVIIIIYSLTYTYIVTEYQVRYNLVVTRFVTILFGLWVKN